MHELKSLDSKIKILKYYLGKNKYAQVNLNILNSNFKQSKMICNLLYNNLELLKSEFNEDYIMCENYINQLKFLTGGVSQGVSNVSFSNVLYN